MHFIIVYKDTLHLNIDSVSLVIQRRGHRVTCQMLDEVIKENVELSMQYDFLSCFDTILSLCDLPKEWYPFLEANSKGIYTNTDAIPDITKEERVVLTDVNGNDLGTMNKTDAHVKGVLHKAISVLLFDKESRLLIQQRGLQKYHWAGVWSNAVCSHPRTGESPKDAAERRVYEELGIKTELNFAFDFMYKAYDLNSGLTEHEYDFVFLGTYEGDFNLNTYEVNAIEWVEKEALLADMQLHPNKYSFWFKIILNELKSRELM